MPVRSRFPIAPITILALGVGGAPAESADRSEIAGLSAPITIEIDRHAVPVIVAEDARDAHAGLGFLHAEQRFFQMDVLRRKAAGELSGLAGALLLNMDREPAIARRRDLARTIFRGLPADQRITIEAYTRGVNAGMDAWSKPPAEYVLLNATPARWRTEDCVLVVLAMFDLLQRTSDQEATVEALRSLVSPEAATWLLSETSPWDALLVEPDEPESPPVPPLASRSTVAPALPIEVSSRLIADERRPGSNSFAVAGSRSVHGHAILANDPHLAYTAPGIWYRVALSWPGVDAVGLSLPGTPGLTIGSTRSIAWGLTNTTGDFEDLVVVRLNPDDPDVYLGPDGWEPFDDRDVTIEVAGSRPQTIRSRFTRWGPVVQMETERGLALLRSMDQPNAVNFDILDFLDAKTVDEGLDIAAGWGGPSQNVLVADADGRIGWTISGWIPNRVGYDGLSPTIHDREHGWFGPLPEDERPRVVDPESGILFTANNRLVPEPQAARIGRVWAGPSRAYRIRELLESRERFTETDLFSLQHDEYAQALAPYRRLLEDALADRGDFAGAAETSRILREWDGRASKDTTAIPIVEAFRRSILGGTKVAMLERFQATNATVDRATAQLAAAAIREPPVLAAIRSRDPDLLPSDHVGWDEIMDEAVEAAIVSKIRNGDTTWSRRNLGRFQHPLGRAHPLVGTRFDLPSVPQPGHWGAVRVQHGAFGASARLVVAPNRLEEGILTTPGGQSGDPKSDNFSDLHQSWATAEPVPLLPLEPVETRTVSPADAPSPKSGRTDVTR